MGTATILTLLIPYIPNALNFLSEQLGRVVLRQSPNVPAETDEQRVLKTIKDIVTAVDAAHPSWTDAEKRHTAAGGIRHHLQRIYGITLADREVNLQIELCILRLRTEAKDHLNL
jgi:hypothetical protein